MRTLGEIKTLVALDKVPKVEAARRRQPCQATGTLTETPFCIRQLEQERALKEMNRMRICNKVRSCTTLVLFCCATICSAAKDIRAVNVLVDESCSISVPFEVKSFALSNKDVARVEQTSPNMLRVTGCRNGRCELNVQGNMDILSQEYEISVYGDDPTWLKIECLRSDLEHVPEVHVEIVSNLVRVDGEVPSLKKWIYLKEVLKAQKALPLKDSVRFIPRDPMVISGLRDKLVHEGFDVILIPFCESNGVRRANSVNIWYDKRLQKLFVRALVDSEEMRKRIFNRLKDEGAWLRFDVVNGIKMHQNEDFDGRTSLDVQVLLLGEQIMRDEQNDTDASNEGTNLTENDGRMAVRLGKE